MPTLAQGSPLPRIYATDIAWGIGQTPTPNEFVVALLVSGVLNGLGSSLSPLVGFVDNLADTPLVVTFYQSDDNAISDAYAGINARVKGASVASFTVNGYGRLQFSIETLTKAYLKIGVTPNLSSTPTPPAWGRLLMTHFFGQLDEVLEAGVP